MLPARRTWNLVARRLGRRLVRGLRLMLVALALIGITPAEELLMQLVGPGETVEQGADIAQVSGQAGCADTCEPGCPDPGCDGDLHRCSCCPVEARALRAIARWDHAHASARLPSAPHDRGPPPSSERPPTPPPRA